jgi:putative addiction module CopG family antidote
MKFGIVYGLRIIYTETAMELALPPDTTKIIEECVQSGEYSSAEEVVSAAIHRLRDDVSGDFAPGELDRLMEEGKNSGPPIPLETAKANMKAFKEAFLASRK